MDGRDYHSIGRSVQEELRRRAVFLVEHDGLTQAEAARVVGVERQAVNIWVKRQHAEGDDGLLDGRRVSSRRNEGILTETEVHEETVVTDVPLASAGTVVAELGDRTRFANPRQLMACLGLVTSKQSSGDRRHQGGITKAGNNAACRMLVEAA